MCPTASGIKFVQFRAFRGSKKLLNEVGISKPQTKILPDNNKRQADENSTVLMKLKGAVLYGSKPRSTPYDEVI